MAKKDPALHERTLFIIAVIYFMSLQLEDLVITNKKDYLKMNNFFCDSNNNWWLRMPKQNNGLEHNIPVKKEVLEHLKRWRTHLELKPFPSANDNKPLFLKKVIGGYTSSLTSIDYSAKFIKNCFYQATEELLNDNLIQEAESLKKIVPRWIKNTEMEELNKRILMAKKMYTENQISIQEICIFNKISRLTFYKYIELAPKNTL